MADKLNVLMMGRIGLLEKGGGDKVQIENTARELREFGINVDIKTGMKTNYLPYDLVHVFQLDWTPETFFYAKMAKEAGKPLVLSPIHHSVKEVKKFDDVYTFDLRRLSRFLFTDQHYRDTFKNVYRCFFDSAKIKPTVKSVFMGLKNMHKKTLQLADHVLVQTELEAKDLKETYGADFIWTKVPNGVGEPFLNPPSGVNPAPFKDYLLCVGRIEPRKNQLSIIEAVRRAREQTGMGFKLVFVGRKSVQHHFEYILRFNKQVKLNKWIAYIPEVPYDQMPLYYQHARAGVSASWFETTGLTSLEALFCGTNAVASGKRAQEYLGDKAFYCSPDNIESIKKAVIEAYNAPPPTISDEMRKSYTWENAARKTLEVYRNVLK